MKRTGQWGRKVWIMFRPWRIFESLSRVFRFYLVNRWKIFQLSFGKINPLLRMAWLLKMLMSRINKVVHLFSSMEEIVIYRTSWEYACCGGFVEYRNKEDIILDFEEPFAGCAKLLWGPRGMACYFWWGHSEGLWVASSDCLSQQARSQLSDCTVDFQLGPATWPCMRQFVRITGCEQKSVMVSISSHRRYISLLTPGCISG